MATRIDSGISPLELLSTQRSHVLFVLSDAASDTTRSHAALRDWYLGSLSEELMRVPGVLNLQHFEQHEIDITQGHFARPPFRYLGLCDLSLDGAEAASDLIDTVQRLHREQPAAKAPATWLYYPASEKVGRSPATASSMLTVAFANGLAGEEAEFREWYATRHIRHALKIPALVSGQCFERTQFQEPGAMEAVYTTIAVYEQANGPESIIAGFDSLPERALDFPMLNLSRFAESVYRPV